MAFAPRKRATESGQAAVLIALCLFSMVVFLAMATNMGILVNDRIRMQNAADLAAYAGAFEQARILNRLTQLNRRIFNVAAMTRKQLTCRDLPDLDEAIHYESTIDCDRGTRTLVALGCNRPPRGPEAYIKAQVARMKIDAAMFMALNHRGKGSPNRAARFTAIRNFPGLGRPRHHSFYDWMDGSPTSKLPPKPLIKVERAQTTFHYAQWYRRGQCSFCPAWKRVGFIWIPINIGGCIFVYPSGPHKTWFYKSPPGPNVFFPVRVNGVPKKGFLDIRNLRGGYFGGDAQRGVIRGTDELWAFAVAKPYGGFIGPSDGQGEAHSVTFKFWIKRKTATVYDWDSFNRNGVGAKFFPTYRARMAGLQERMMAPEGGPLKPIQLMMRDIQMATHVKEDKIIRYMLH